MSASVTNISTSGGASIGGNVQAARDVVGRDQFNVAIHLQDVNGAVQTVQTIAAALNTGDLESDAIRAQFLSLMEELRKTHSTLVKVISPLRRIDNNEATFAQQFRAVYNDFRDFYDSYDFWNERTHCSKVKQIAQRLEKHSAPVTQTPEWDQLRHALGILGDADIDVIEAHYVPFMHNFNRVMIEIEQHVADGQISQAILLKQVFLNELNSQYDRIKAMLTSMTNTIGDIEALLG